MGKAAPNLFFVDAPSAGVHVYHCQYRFQILLLLKRLGLLKAPVSLVTIWIANRHFDTCADNVANYMLMSKWVYDLLSHKCVGPLEETTVCLSCASGKPIKTYECTWIRFWTEQMHYEYLVLLCDLTGIDVLLDFDWLITVGVILSPSHTTGYEQ